MIICSWARTSNFAKCYACHNAKCRAVYAVSPKKTAQQLDTSAQLAARRRARHPYANRQAVAAHRARHPYANRQAGAAHRARHPQAVLLARRKFRLNKPLSVVNSRNKYYRVNKLRILRDGRIRRRSAIQLPFTRPLLRVIYMRRRTDTQAEYVYNLHVLDFAAKPNGMSCS